MIKNDLIHILDNIIEKRKFSNIEINYYFKIKNYNIKEKAFIKNLLTITIKNLIYIDYIIDSFAKKINKKKTRQILRISIAQMYFTDSDKKGVVYEAVELAKEINIEQGKFVNAILRKVIKGIDEKNKYIESNKLCNIKYSYPKWLYEKIKIDWEDSSEEILKNLKNRSYLSIRINRKKINEIDFLKKIEKLEIKILHRVEDVFYIDGYKILEEKLFKKDEIFIQDASSYIVSKLMDIKDNEKVLDSCSAPGGKSIAMLNLFNPSKIVACDIYEHKLDKLRELVDEYKYDNIEILNRDASKKNQFEKECFDKILLDVPCSGIGVLRRKPEKIYTLTNNNIKSLKKLQKKIFDSNIEYLKKGGSIIYSTCTITKNENTNNVEYFLEKYKDLEVMPITLPENVSFIKDKFGGVYINPSNEFLDGFYIIKFKKG